MDAEARRLKNRVRQQRYRARKREEKAKRDEYVFQGNHSACVETKPLPEDCSILPTPTLDNGHAASRLDVGVIDMPVNAQTSPQEGNGNCGKDSTGISVSATVTARNGHEGIPVQQQSVVQSFGVNVRGDTDMTPNRMSSTHNVIFIQPLAGVEYGYRIGERTKRTYDLMARRLKNRERQRRYRARKRLEADTKNAYLRTEPPESAGIVKFEARVRCHRNWKKDAREFHASKIPESTSLGDSAPRPTKDHQPNPARHASEIPQSASTVDLASDPSLANEHQPNSSPHVSEISESTSVGDLAYDPSLANQHQPNSSPHVSEISDSTSVGDLASVPRLTSKNQPNSSPYEPEIPNSISVVNVSSTLTLTNEGQPNSLSHEPEIPNSTSVADISSAPSLINEQKPDSLPHEPEIPNIISVADISSAPILTTEHQPNSSPKNLEGFHDPVQVKAETPPGAEFQSGPPVTPEDNGANDTMPGPRHWKVEARNKMKEEPTV